MSSRIVSVSYGHSLAEGQKFYDYETNKNYRAGDVIVVPVEHHKSHKLYNTLAVVRRTTDEDTKNWKKRADNLTTPDRERTDGKIIRPKNVAQRLEIAQRQGLDVSSQRDVTVRTLPGYKGRESNEKWSSGSRLISREE